MSDVIMQYNHEDFNPRPREGGRRSTRRNRRAIRRFQSTPPRGGATRSSTTSLNRNTHFNPRPREGGRRGQIDYTSEQYAFQSTPPRGGATAFESWIVNMLAISIHAPARGGDDGLLGMVTFAIISIHAPARGGDIARARRASIDRFQSTPPRGGATSRPSDVHARERSFNPRPREGGRRQLCGLYNPARYVSIHAPARGGDAKNTVTDGGSYVSIHAPARGGDTP